MQGLKPVVVDQEELDWEGWIDPAFAARSAVRWKLLVSGDRGPTARRPAASRLPTDPDYRLNPRSSCRARSSPSASSSGLTRRPIAASIALASTKVSTPA